MNRFRILLKVAVVVALLVLTSSAALAQTSKGAIAGTVVDKSSAAVVGATITARNTQLVGEERTTTSDSTGAYRIDAINPGIYLVIMKAPGFADLSISNVDVRASVVVTVNGTLEVSAVSATVTVEAGAAQELQTTTGEISGSISRKEVLDLPILGLNPISLVLTLPGVLRPSSREDFTNGVGFSVNGTRPRGNNFLLDGQSNNDLSITGQAFQPQNEEAISEVTILTNSYTAEYGKGGGSVTNVTYKGGSNEFHGVAWDLYRASALQAIDASNKPPVGNSVNCGPAPAPPPAGDSCKSVSNENTFGFAFGGRLIRDKLFFFGTSQWDKFRTSATDLALRVPTANGVAALQTLLPNARVAALINAIGDLRGQTSLTTLQLGNGRPAVETGFVQPSGIGQFSNSYEWDVRGDYLPTVNDTVSARYLASRQTFAPDTFANPGQLPGFRTQQGGPSNNLSTSWVHTFSPRALNEFRFAYSLIDFKFDLLPSTAANPAAQGPTSFITGLFGVFATAGIGVNTGFPQGRNNQTWQFQDSATVTRGRHTFKFGLDLANYLATQAVPFDSRGSITYNLAGSFSALANYIDDVSGSGGTVSRNFGSPIVHPDQTIQGYFAQDEWKILQNFTLNFGVRYEYYGTPENVLQFPAMPPVRGQIGVPYPAVFEQVKDKNNWGPRFGFAYTPRFWKRVFGEDKTVIRGGYGLFYDGLFNNILVNTAASAPNVAGGSIPGVVNASNPRGTPSFSTLVGSIIPGVISPLLGIFTIDQNLVSPLTHQWNFNIQREIPWNFIVTAAYVGTRGVRLFGNDEFNVPINGVRENTARGAVTARTNGRDSIYHSGQFKLERSFRKGFLMRASYTYSKLIDNASEVFTTSGGSSRLANFLNPRGDRGLSAFDRRQRLALTYVYEIPYVKRDGGGWSILRAATRDWEISGTIQFQSGAPQTVSIIGFDMNRDLNGGNDRPSLGNPSAPFNTIAIDGGPFGLPAGTFFEIQNFLACDDVTIPCVPVSPQNFHFLIKPGFGNIGRNTVITNGRQDWTIGLLRRIKLPMKHLESQQIEVRTEFFNPFNHPNQGIQSLNTLSAFFNDSSQSRFGGREIRFWLKYRF